MLRIINETLIELIETEKMTGKMTDKNEERTKLVIKYLNQNNSINNKEAKNLLNIKKTTENILEAVGEYKARKYIKK